MFQQAYRSERYPALAALFYKLCELLRYSIVPVFVFDGPNRPDFKRGKPVDKKAHPLAERFQSMISAFGFYFYTVSFPLAILVLC